jgi:putative membrane protein
MLMESKKSNKLITVASIVIPLVVALLLSPNVKVEGYDFSFLPGIYATINGITAALLIISYINIKRGKRHIHERLMITCMFLGLAFLVMYIIYHITTNSTPYGGEGLMRGLYFFILISHIVLSVVVIPLVLLAFARARENDFIKHKKLARFAFPIWLYVAITGVLVYVMISPYYT